MKQDAFLSGDIVKSIVDGPKNFLKGQALYGMAIKDMKL